MATVASGRPLTFGDYKDVSRPLRRMLKQCGTGSMEVGIVAARGNGNAIVELELLLGVDKQVRWHALNPGPSCFHPLACCACCGRCGAGRGLPRRAASCAMSSHVTPESWWAQNLQKELDYGASQMNRPGATIPASIARTPNLEAKVPGAFALTSTASQEEMLACLAEMGEGAEGALLGVHAWLAASVEGAQLSLAGSCTVAAPCASP